MRDVDNECRNTKREGASSTVEEKEKKNTIVGDPKICAPKVEKSTKAAWKKMKREDDREL